MICLQDLELKLLGKLIFKELGSVVKKVASMKFILSKILLELFI